MTQNYKKPKIPENFLYQKNKYIHVHINYHIINKTKKMSPPASIESLLNKNK